MERVPFSQRVGAAPPPLVGLREMPEPLRISLWNVFQVWLFSDNVPGQSAIDLARRVFDHIHWAADTVAHYDQKNRLKFKEWFTAAAWHQVYEFIEWLPHLIASGKADPYGGGHDQHVLFGRKYLDDVARVLEREGAPYRWLGVELTPITDDTELAEVDRALNSAFAGAREHISQALTLFSLKPEPDYRNTIKESVSAIESALIEATGEKGDFPKLLAAFEHAHGAFHPAFKKAVSALYGWTSDKEANIRHGIFGDKDPDSADARFMLVTCSAFVNFLVQYAR
jgi:hypothetical protein